MDVILMPEYWKSLRTFLFQEPINQPGYDQLQIYEDAIEPTMKKAKEAVKMYQNIGWFQEEPNYFVLDWRNFSIKESMHTWKYRNKIVHPISPQQVAELFDQGKVESNEVMLMDTVAVTRYGNLKSQQQFWYPEKLDEAVKLQKTKIIVFICDHAGSNSTEFAKSYLRWKLQNYPEQVERENSSMMPLICVLSGGKEPCCIGQPKMMVLKNILRLFLQIHSNK